VIRHTPLANDSEDLYHPTHGVPTLPSPHTGSFPASADPNTGVPMFPATAYYSSGSVMHTSPHYFQPESPGLQWPLSGHGGLAAPPGHPPPQDQGYQYEEHADSREIADYQPSVTPSVVDFDLTWNVLAGERHTAASPNAPASLKDRMPGMEMDHDKPGYVSRNVRRTSTNVSLGVTEGRDIREGSAEGPGPVARKQPPRPRNLPPQDQSRASVSSQASASTTQSTNAEKPAKPSKLRSASRTSKNSLHRPSETLEERKSRTSHNRVEREYRNRLNSAFEILLERLPVQIGGEGSGDGEGVLDFGNDRRVSKSEVLDGAVRYISRLERERDALRLERDELLGRLSVRQSENDSPE